MIPIEEAERIVDEITRQPNTLSTEKIPLMDSLGRVLGQDIVSTISMPPFDKSAMDGYAVISGDDANRFEIVEIIAAGSVPQKTIAKGQCAKIMTGAMLPPGADRVIKQEVTEEKDGFMVLTGEDKNINICYLGEDIKPGDVVLKTGSLIRPPEIGVIASMGLNSVRVYEKPRVGIITTGSEIVSPGQALAKGQIYNSNAYSIAAQVIRTGADIMVAGIVQDDKEHIRGKIADLLKHTQMVLISGGVSVGDFDFVPGILKDLGVCLHFEEIAAQPGRPTVFGTWNDVLIFGLPGNPVSTFIMFEVLARKALCRLMGYEFAPLFLKGVMKKKFHRKRVERAFFVPVKYDNEGFVEPVEYHGSAHLAALPQANALLTVPMGVHEIAEGSVVYVRQI
ncbi:MAG: Molybdopterin molybdenumtransferase [Acidobacteriota bacterium]|nr:Molybdopterin molybdenumtransferase [Acidobacteriota bacterium]